MRFVFLLLFIMLFLTVSAQSDSIQNVNLQEVTVLGEQKIETPTHTTLVPTSSDRSHSTNALDLIKVMNISDLETSYNSKQIFNNRGQEVIICINGVEVSPDELSALRSKNVVSIEFQRNPTGKYSGKGGVLNFKTIQYNYGGNVYLSAKESFIYNSGDYLASADYSQNNNRLSFIYSNNWGINRNKQNTNNQYYFSNGNVLGMESQISPIKRKDYSNTVNLRYSNNGDNYRVSVIGGFTDTHTPYNNRLQQIDYTGYIKGISTANNISKSYGNAFSMKGNYTQWLPKQQIIDLSASASLGKGDYHYLYQETQQDDIQSDAYEKNHFLSGTLQYIKTFNNNMDLTVLIDHYYNYYNDQYGGTVSDNQILENNVSLGTLQLSKYTTKLSFYVTAGISNMNIRQNDNKYNYLNPTCYYGVTYSPKNNFSLLFNGFYVHTIFDPSNKNDISIPTSFFEVTQGNPDLKPLNVLSNSFELNYNFGKTSLTASYMNYIYFDNILYVYETDNNYIYTSMSNDGNFYGNMFTVTLAHKMFEDKLNISLKGIEEYNIIKGKVYNKKKNVLRGKFKIDYTVKKMRLGAEFSTPYKALDIRAPFYIKKRFDMSVYAIWDWSNWRLEASIHNPFTKYAISEHWMDYGCFNMNTKKYDLAGGRSMSIKVVFNIGYGKKSKPESHSVQRVLNSAILKSY